MKTLKVKLIALALVFIFVLFFSNDFGLIDVEKTAIITAIAIDFKNDEYSVTAQVAVPESTNTNTENKKAQITGKGNTVCSAINNVGDTTGWYPKLDFCNLIVISRELAKQNVISVLDFFSKTLRIQDSAIVVVAEEEAKDILTVSTPLDNISSFALQKVLLKTSGFDKEIAQSNIKNFAEGFYSSSSSSVSPVIKVMKQTDSGDKGESSNNSMESPENEETSLFNATSTALFFNGIMVGELNDTQTFAYNLIFSNCKGSTIDVPFVQINGENANYLMSIKKHKCKVKTKIINDRLQYHVHLDLFCDLIDQNTKKESSVYIESNPIPQEVLNKANLLLTEYFKSLFESERESDCDFMKLKERIFRYHNKYYDKLKDSYTKNTDFYTHIKVEGQK